MKVSLFDVLLNRSMSRDLFLGLILVVAFVTLIAGSIYFSIITQREVRIFKEQADETTENLAKISSYAIYRSDHSVTGNLVREYQKREKVVSVFLFDELHNITFFQGDGIQGRHVIVKKPIRLFNRRLGSVEVVFTVHHIIRQQRMLLYYTFIITFCIIVSFGIATMMLLKRFISQPFSALIDGVGAIAAGSYEQRLAPIKYHYINIIGQNVNTMAEKIAARERHLKMIVEKLGKQVVEREEAESALREVKERYEEMANLLPETVYETDERGFFTFLNRNGFDRFGCGHEDIENGLKFIDLFASQDRDRIENDLKSVFSGQVIGSAEYLAKNKNEATFQVLVHFNPIMYNRKIQGIRGIAVDITERKRAEEELLLYQEKLRSLTNELLFAEERERHRIASEIHDRIGHALTNVSIKIGLLRDTVNVTEKNILLKDINKLIEQSVKDVQSLIFDISPPILYDIGLVAAIDWFIEKTSKEHGLKIVLKHDDELKPINNQFRVLIFRAVRELLLNVVKHANANYAEVLITREEEKIVISVKDNGVGMSEDCIDPQSGIEGFGLFSIRERLSHFNGHLIVRSKPRQGTLITMEIPDA